VNILLANAHGADRTSGGAERYVGDLRDGLVARGHEVTVVAAFPPATSSAGAGLMVLHPDDPRRSEVRRFRNHLRDALSVPTRLVSTPIAEIQPDVLHTSNLSGISTAIWESARVLGVPVVHTIHDYYLVCRRVTLVRRNGRPCGDGCLSCRVRAARLRRWAPAVSAVIAVSEHLLERHDLIFPGAAQHVIRHPLMPLAPHPIPPPRNPPQTVSYLGRLDATKGIQVLLEAAPGIRGLGLRLHVAGDGELRREVEEAARRGDLEYHGSLHGDDLVAFYASTDCAIVPSVWDEPGGPPYVVVEWLSAGRPVVVSDRGGLRELSGRAGVVCIAPVPSALVAALARIVSGEIRGAAEATGREDIDRWLGEHEAVYRAVVNTRAEAPRGATDRAGRPSATSGPRA
jgi:glycosyltransferase involved in cell wall biosynthesis